MLKKSRVFETIEKFPEAFTIDELTEKLIFLEKVEQGIQQSRKGEVISEEELDKEIQKWFR